MVLPGEWTRQPSSDLTRWSYASRNAERLTVSFIRLPPEQEAEERSKTFDRLVELRKKAETALPELSPITTTETNFGESGGILAARYAGVEPAAKRRFFCLMLGSSQAFTVFYYEAVGLTEVQSEARAKTIMNTIVVPQ